MNEEELKALKKTMPWSERVVKSQAGVRVYVIDCNGAEVPIFTMIKFLTLVTTKMATKETENDATS
jgi:hypothetical protein